MWAMLDHCAQYMSGVISSVIRICEKTDNEVATALKTVDSFTVEWKQFSTKMLRSLFYTTKIHRKVHKFKSDALFTNFGQPDATVERRWSTISAIIDSLGGFKFSGFQISYKGNGPIACSTGEKSMRIGWIAVQICTTNSREARLLHAD